MKKIALIGYGYWGKKLYPYLEKRFDVACVYGRSLKKGGVFTSRVEDAFADEIDAIVVATPIGTHYEVVRQALEKGKQVLCEKPLTQRSEEARELAHIAEKRNLLLLTDYTYTFSRGLNHAKEIIDDGCIGTLQAMDLSLKHVGRFVGQDVYWLLGSHMLSVLDMFISLDSLSLRKISFIYGETGVVLFDGPIKGQISVSINYPLKDSTVIFYGSRGTLVYDGLETPAINFIQYDKELGIPSNELIIERTWFHYDETNNLKHVINHFADALETGDTCRTNLKRSLQVTNILEVLN